MKTFTPRIKNILKAIGFQFGLIFQDQDDGIEMPKSVWYKIKDPDVGPLIAGFTDNGKFYIGYGPDTDLAVIPAKRRNEAEIIKAIEYYHYITCRDNAYKEACHNPSTDNVELLVRLLKEKISE